MKIKKPPILDEVKLGGHWSDKQVEIIVEIQRDADLKWFVAWGNELCPHVLRNTSYHRKDGCDWCWQELEKLAGKQ